MVQNVSKIQDAFDWCHKALHFEFWKPSARIKVLVFYPLKVRKCKNGTEV